ncbi:VCBS repeat-containing protein [Microvirga sp. STR05]|uniref:VCBS repeat-containing protein n=1 Tax=Hymenobacter duratus TaxID=2771356 RepID=A0ABR8JKC6_9BACT|nr:FG-GAP-like repeat-containing protein [Hymenobacter duratus]MBD2717321.1 VCBS repeat-containing protein [Hymenobacter duratus]MBR7952243.1 VCBS repeat-containing protein [Microvirga sp. STR05]
MALLLALQPALAQGPGWQMAQAGSATQAPGTGSSTVTGTATDASGNVFVTGYFSNKVVFGSTTLTSAGGLDVFVAKWVPSTNTWAWAYSGGGSADDRARDIAVSGSNVYVTGTMNDFSYYYSSGYGSSVPSMPTVRFGSISLAGYSTSYYSGSTHSSFSGTNYLYGNMVLLRYTDAGNSATLSWAQSSSVMDQTKGLAVDGSAIYVVGSQTLPYSSSSEHCQAFRGCHTDYYSGGQSNIVLQRYDDTGTGATNAWTQTAGGKSYDQGQDVAVSGSYVYITGSVYNNAADANVVRFGTTAVPGSTSTYSSDLLVARYTTAGVFGWARVGGGTSEDIGLGIAVNGTSVYVTGTITNTTADATAVRFGGTVAVAGASTTLSTDVLLARYTDAGVFSWARAGGGSGEDRGLRVAANSTAAYVTGYSFNTAADANAVRFGGNAVAGTSATASNDMLVARYASNGTFSWARTGGGSGSDEGGGIAVSGTTLYVGGYAASPAATFGTAAGSPVLGGTTGTNRAVAATLTDATSSATWQTAKTSSHGGTSSITATAVNASGEVFVTGTFKGEVTFGSTTLGSAGDNDLFVAKWVPSSSTWAWAVAGGGAGTDGGTGIAVNGNAVYVSGTVSNSTTDVNAVRFGTTAVAGASPTLSDDLLLARYTDNGSSAAFNWARTGGGSGVDKATAIAVNGSAVYLTGSITNNLADANAVRFSGTALAGASATASPDVVLARYTDNTTSATLAWARTGGGTGADAGNSIAVANNLVYITGSITNTLADANAVRFSGMAVAGASATASADVVLARYTDNTTGATLAWVTSGGGVGADEGMGIAVANDAVYITGFFSNNATDANAVRFGGVARSGFGTNPYYTDLLVARYTDTGSSAAFNWAEAGGSDNFDKGLGIAVTGTTVYVTGTVTGTDTPPRFGGTPVLGTNKYSSDVVVASYTDNTSSATCEWTTVGGGNGTDTGAAVALNAPYVYVAGSVLPEARFSDLRITSPANYTVNFLGALDVSKPHIGWVSPASGVAGTAVTMSSHLLGGASNLVVNGVSTLITANTDKTISFVLPIGVGPTNLITATTNAGPVSTTLFTALLSPVTYSPAVNTRTALVLNSRIGLTFSESITAAPGNVLHVFSAQAGGRKAGTVSLNGNALSFASSGSGPNASFKPGEVISVSLAGTIQNAGGLLANKRVYQFTTAVAGSGGGKFQTPAANAEPAVGTTPGAVAVADVDGDGDLDLLSTSTANNSVVVRLNNGSGVFTAPTTGATVGVTYSPQDLAVGDLDGDGDLDLATASSATGMVSIRLNNGSGNFVAPSANAEVYTSTYSRGLTLGDIDGDGDLDLLVANYYSNTVSVRLNNGSGSFTYPAANAEIMVNQNPHAIALGDFDGDGDLDLFTSASSYYSGNTVRVSVNNGTGGFAYWQELYVGSTPSGVTLGDIDGDGDLDLLSANSTGTTVSLRVNNGRGYFVAPSSNAELSVGSGPRTVALGDVDSDGDLDVLTANYNDNTVSVRVNDGSGNFTVPDVSASLSVGTSPVQATLGDVDGDGDLDLLSANSGNGTVSVRFNEPKPLTVTALSANAELPGMPLTISGTGFMPGCSVSIGGADALNVVINSSTSITATVPAGALPGTNPVVVTLGAATAPSPTTFTVLALYAAVTTSCPSTVPYLTTGDGKWHYLLASNGQVVAALQDTRASLGTVTVSYQVTGSASPVRADSRNRKYLDRNFRLVASGGDFPGQTMNVRFFGLTSELARLQTADPTVGYATLYATQYSGSNEDCQLENNDFQAGQFRSLTAAASTPGNGVAWFVAQLAVQDHFSEFYLTGSAAPLPVELSAFTATKRGQAVELAWRTASEKNNDRFEVERSTDGHTFERIGTVAGHGTTTRPTDYSYGDSQYPSLASVLYYRLRQVDQNGSAHLSPIQVVQLDKIASLQLYPNPTRASVTVTGVAAHATIEVIDALGRVRLTVTAEQSGRTVLPLPAELPSGVYIVRSQGLTGRLRVE